MNDVLRRCRGARILALLCNPPLRETSLTTSWRNLQTLRGVLGANEIVICNLIEVPSRSSEELGHLSGLVDLSQLAVRIKSEASMASLVVAAWGTHRPAGWKARHWSELIISTLDGLADSGHDGAIHVGPSARHPSRWRQYTSPVHQRFVGPTFENRLRESLQWSGMDFLRLSAQPSGARHPKSD